MTEWYVLAFDPGMAVAIILGRKEAVDVLTAGQRLTEDERRRIRRFLEGGLCDLGTGPRIAGRIPDIGPREPDRLLIRVTGPGTEV